MSNITQPEENVNEVLKFGEPSQSGCYYSGHPKDLLTYGPALIYTFLKKVKIDNKVRMVPTYNILTPQQVLIIIRMYDSWKDGISTVIREDLARSITSNPTQVSALIKPLLWGEFICPFCKERFDVIKRGKNHYYKEDKLGSPGHTYKLDGVKDYIGHLTLKHKLGDQDAFWKFLKHLATFKKDDLRRFYQDSEF